MSADRKFDVSITLPGKYPECLTCQRVAEKLGEAMATNTIDFEDPFQPEWVEISCKEVFGSHTRDCGDGKSVEGPNISMKVEANGTVTLLACENSQRRIRIAFSGDVDCPHFFPVVQEKP